MMRSLSPGGDGVIMRSPSPGGEGVPHREYGSGMLRVAGAPEVDRGGTGENMQDVYIAM
jgi:hypothetical protein